MINVIIDIYFFVKAKRLIAEMQKILSMRK